MNYAVVSDVDGVILRSAEEGLLAAMNVLEGRSFDNQNAPKLFLIDFENFAHQQHALKNARPHLTGAAEFLTLAYIAREGLKIKDRQSFVAATDALRSDLKGGYDQAVEDLEVFRQRLMKSSDDTVSRLITPYEGIKRVIESAQGVGLYISSSKPRVEDYLAKEGIHVDLSRIYNKKRNGPKSNHLLGIHESHGVAFQRMLMIEDSLEEAVLLTSGDSKRIEPAQVFFAEWGYNTPAQRSEATRLGFEVGNMHALYQRIQQLQG